MIRSFYKSMTIYCTCKALAKPKLPSLVNSIDYQGFQRTSFNHGMITDVHHSYFFLGRPQLYQVSGRIDIKESNTAKFSSRLNRSQHSSCAHLAFSRSSSFNHMVTTMSGKCLFGNGLKILGFRPTVRVDEPFFSPYFDIL